MQASRGAGLRKGKGKMVFEVKPDVRWNKGEAVVRVDAAWLTLGMHCTLGHQSSNAEGEFLRLSLSVTPWAVVGAGFTGAG